MPLAEAGDPLCGKCYDRMPSLFPHHFDAVWVGGGCSEPSRIEHTYGRGGAERALPDGRGACRPHPFDKYGWEKGEEEREILQAVSEEWHRERAAGLR